MGAMYLGKLAAVATTLASIVVVSVCSWSKGNTNSHKWYKDKNFYMKYSKLSKAIYMLAFILNLYKFTNTLHFVYFIEISLLLKLFIQFLPGFQIPGVLNK